MRERVRIERQNSNRDSDDDVKGYHKSRDVCVRTRLCHQQHRVLSVINKMMQGEWRKSLSLSLYTHVCIICYCWIEEEWGKQFSQSHVLLALIYGDIDLQNARWKWNIRNNKSWCRNSVTHSCWSPSSSSIIHSRQLGIGVSLLHNAATVITSYYWHWWNV